MLRHQPCALNERSSVIRGTLSQAAGWSRLWKTPASGKRHSLVLWVGKGLDGFLERGNNTTLLATVLGCSEPPRRGGNSSQRSAGLGKSLHAKGGKGKKQKEEEMIICKCVCVSSGFVQVCPHLPQLSPDQGRGLSLQVFVCGCHLSHISINSGIFCIYFDIDTQWLALGVFF